MRVTGECVQDEDGVIAGLVEGTPGFVTDGHLRQGHAGLELQVADVQLTQIALRFGVLGAGARHGDGCGDRLAGSAGLASALGGHGGSLHWVGRRGGAGCERGTRLWVEEATGWAATTPISHKMLRNGESAGGPKSRSLSGPPAGCITV